MSVKPILYNTEMVMAILEGKKTVTRRVIKPQPYCMAPRDCGCTVWNYGRAGEACSSNCLDLSCTFENWPYKEGDVLYVRETWCKVPGVPSYLYKASCSDGIKRKWKPSIHMPKEAARIFLRVTDVKVERLTALSAEDALKEGCNPTDSSDLWTARDRFEDLWNSTVSGKDYEKYCWSANPWVWVIEFERIEKPEGVGNG